MPWFRLEDSFANNPKVTKAGNAATGLWVRCGTYSAQYLTDGHIPHDVARGYGRHREIDALLDAEMWIENGTGFLIPDYLEYNPSKKQVLAERAAARDRMTRRRRNSRGEFD
jgi:hypothetical protein